MVLVVKNPPANVGDTGDLDLIPGSGRSPGGGHCNPLQCSCLETPVESQKSWMRLKRLSTHTDLRRSPRSGSSPRGHGGDEEVSQRPGERGRGS